MVVVVVLGVSCDSRGGGTDGDQKMKIFHGHDGKLIDCIVVRELMLSRR